MAIDGTISICLDNIDSTNAAFRVAETLIPEGTVYINMGDVNVCTEVFLPLVKNVVVTGGCPEYRGSPLLKTFFACVGMDCHLRIKGESNLVEVSGTVFLGGHLHSHMVIFEGLGFVDTVCPNCPALKEMSIVYMPTFDQSLVPSLSTLCIDGGGDFSVLGTVGKPLTSFTMPCPCGYSTHSGLTKLALAAEKSVVYTCPTCVDLCASFISDVNEGRRYAGKGPVIERLGNHVGVQGLVS